jgi:hypothetical protein
MTPSTAVSEIRMIPDRRIEVLNPRDRNKRVFDETRRQHQGHRPEESRSP